MADVAVVAVALTGLTAACYAFRRWTEQDQATNVPPKRPEGTDTGQTSAGDDVDAILTQVRDSVKAAENMKKARAKVRVKEKTKPKPTEAVEIVADAVTETSAQETTVLCGFVVKSVDVSIKTEAPHAEALHAEAQHAEAPHTEAAERGTVETRAAKGLAGLSEGEAPIEELLKPELKVEAWLNGMTPSDRSSRPGGVEMFDGESKEHGEGWREEVYVGGGGVSRERGPDVINRLSTNIELILAENKEPDEAKSVRSKAATSKRTRSSKSPKSTSSSKNRTPASRPPSVIREEPVDTMPDTPPVRPATRGSLAESTTSSRGRGSRPPSRGPVSKPGSPGSSRGQGSRTGSASSSRAPGSKPDLVSGSKPASASGSEPVAVPTANSSVASVSSRPASPVKEVEVPTVVTSKKTRILSPKLSPVRRPMVRDTRLTVQRKENGSKPVITIKQPVKDRSPAVERQSLFNSPSRQVEASLKFLNRQAKLGGKPTPSKPSVQQSNSPTQARVSPSAKSSVNRFATFGKPAAATKTVPSSVRNTAKVNTSRGVLPSRTSLSPAVDKKTPPSKDNLLQKGSATSGHKPADRRHKRVLMVKPSAASTPGSKTVHGCATVTLGPILAAAATPPSTPAGKGSRGRRPANYVWRSMSPIKTLSEDARNARLAETLSKIETDAAAEYSGDDRGGYKPPRSISEVMDTEHVYDTKLTESEPEMRGVEDYNPAGQFFQVTSDDLDKCYVHPDDRNIDFDELIASSGMILYAADKKEAAESLEAVGDVQEVRRDGSLLHVETEGFRKLKDQTDSSRNVNVGGVETRKL